MKYLIICTIAAFFLTSCFEIKEEVNVRKDGSGSIVFTANLSESKAQIKPYLESKEYNGVAIPTKDDIAAEIAKTKAALEKIDGISNVQTRSDFENFVFTITSDFADVTALNDAINKVAQVLNKSALPTLKSDNYAFQNGEFKRLFDYPLDAELYAALPVMAQYMFSTARVISIIRLPNEVKRMSNEQAKLSPSKKAVMVEHKIADIMQAKGSLKNTISY